MAFRAFQISNELQDRYDYPGLTDAVKRDVLGLNAARLFGVDADATRCALATDPLTAAKPAAMDAQRAVIVAVALEPPGADDPAGAARLARGARDALDSWIATLAGRARFRSPLLTPQPLRRPGRTATRPFLRAPLLEAVSEHTFCAFDPTPRGVQPFYI